MDDFKQEIDALIAQTQKRKCQITETELQSCWLAIDFSYPREKSACTRGLPANRFRMGFSGLIEARGRTQEKKLRSNGSLEAPGVYS
jgi:hypothetical protein